MTYPSDFPPESRARVEAQKILAGRDFESAEHTTRWKRDVEAHLRRYILRTFLVFAKEAVALRLWSVDDTDSKCTEFLRLLTINAYHDKGRGLGLGKMISHLNGSILPEVEKEFKKSPEWQQYQDELLALAGYQLTKPVAAPPATEGAQHSARKRKGRPKDSLAEYRRVRISKVAQELNVIGEAYCKALCDSGIEVPIRWQTSEACPKKYIDAFNHPDLVQRKKWRQRIADEKYKATHPKPLAKTRN
jgi:hypothetical protein